ncbi:DUF5693 family protein [Alkalicoccus halolimnae]|uniref:DUF5693 family protein n=1 Tax=Alkalicoccus halolimnae TaxID=1667239 RepID=A0A5C7F4N7_9BACI|nr:DUF5693 family protein [Alkalicoccus halolimnae]TXF85621.1 hypothetical protein FTX54_08510 [Alkalicoccus halolimnae]
MRKKVLWGIVLLIMVLSIPYLGERIAVEEGADTYETVIPYEDINTFTKDAGLDRGTVYEKLTSGAGVQSVAFEPLSLNDLRDRDMIAVVSKSEMIQLYGASHDEIHEESGIFLKVLEENELTESIEESLNFSRDRQSLQVDATVINREEFLFLPFASTGTMREPVTFDMNAYEQAVSYGINIIIRLSDNFQAEHSDHLLYDQMREMSGDISHVLFAGTEIPGGGDPQITSLLAEKINELDISVVLIENADQVGLHPLLDQVVREPVRLQSLTLGKNYDPGNYQDVFRGERAVNERNVDILFINILDKEAGEFYSHPREAERMLERTSQILEAIHENIDDETGIAEPPLLSSLPLWMEVSVIFAAASFTGIVFTLVSPLMAVPAALLSFIIYLTIFLIQIDFLLKLVVLFLAVMAPVYAILRIKRPLTLTDAAGSYFTAAGITLTGAWFVVMLLYGSDFLLGLDSFRGVKVLAAAPLVITGLVFLGWSWLREPVKFWHLVVMVVLGAVILFYITRTGNTGIALPYELIFRQWLENMFIVRPRTTEFLIGLPLFTLGLYLWKEKVKYAWFLLLGGSLALSSLAGTFTHLHTPLLVSIIRSALSLSIGLLIGILLILTYECCKKWIYPFIRERRIG